MLTSEKKIEIAKSVIDGIGIEDEDLKQEMYLQALQFDEGRNCIVCEDYQLCLFSNLVEFATIYQIEADERRARETSVSSSLQSIDDVILAFLAARLGM